MHSGDDWAIILFATRGLGEFVENALLGIRQCGIDPKIVQVLMPANAGDELRPLVERHGARPRIFDDLLPHSNAMPTRYLDYGSQDFNHLAQLRFPLLRIILEESKKIIYADIDVGWLRNPLPYLSRVMSRFPWACQTEAAAVFPPIFCLGFFACQASPECFELMDAHIRRFTVLDGKSMQEVLWRMLDENPAYLSTIFPLPEALFPTGLLHSASKTDSAISATMVAQLEPFVFHGNWTIGIENKRLLLKHAGAWFVSSESSAGFTSPSPSALPIPGGFRKIARRIARLVS